jgi:hypothetical protein
MCAALQKVDSVACALPLSPSLFSQRRFLDMAKNQAKRLAPGKLEADQNCFAALKSIENYSPINQTYALNALTGAHTELQSLQDRAAQAAAAAAAARGEVIAKEWEFHNLMLGVKEQVIAQFGKDSNEVQMLGLKKKSDYRPPARKPKDG